MMKKLEKILMPLAEAIGRNKYLMSIRDGFLVSTPLLIGGSIFLLIANFPIQGWINFLETTVVNSSTGQTLASFISKPAGATFDIMAIFAVIGIAYSFAGKMNTNKIFGAAVAVVSPISNCPADNDRCQTYQLPAASVRLTRTMPSVPRLANEIVALLPAVFVTTAWL